MHHSISHEFCAPSGHETVSSYINKLELSKILVDGSDGRTMRGARRAIEQLSANDSTKAFIPVTVASSVATYSCSPAFGSQLLVPPVRMCKMLVVVLLLVSVLYLLSH